MNIWDLFSLKGKTAVITGGARNLGNDMAHALAEAGANIVVTSRNREQAECAAEEISTRHRGVAIGLQLDVTDEEQVIAVVERIKEAYGKIDVLVNNAGNVVSSPEASSFENISLENWNKVIDANMTGAFLCAKHVVAKSMKPNKAGNIINISSVTGVIGKDRRVYRGSNMGGATLDYHAAKGGVISMTRDMAVYLAPFNIRVNCISPGGFWRNQPEQFVEAYSKTIPMGRMGEDGKEMKGAVVFLASESSSYVTGHNLLVDGGLTIW